MTTGVVRALCATSSILLAATATACGAKNASTAGGGQVTLTHNRAVGEPYAADGPRECSTLKAPTSGPITPELAAKYSTCSAEHESGLQLWLVDKLVVTGISKPRRYNFVEDRNYGRIDVSKPVYDLQGSLDKYQCSRIDKSGYSGPPYAVGTNCWMYPGPHATGACYVDTFGDWQCSLGASGTDHKELQPPPKN